MLSNAKTYIHDLDLFKELGFENFSVNHQNEIPIGTHKLEHYEKAEIKVFVTCMPAQFWRFEIITDEDKSFNIKTGSGTLSDYWKTAVLFAEGMLVV